MLVPAVGAGGFELWSRFPLDVVTPPSGGSMIAARVHVPGVAVRPVLDCVHIASPVPTSLLASFNGWHRGIAAAKIRMTGLADAAGAGAVIVAGDFNSTPDMRQFCALHTNGYRAVEETGAGSAPTFPSHFGLLPLITMDHVLTRNAATASIRTLDVRGSDHR